MVVLMIQVWAYKAKPETASVDEDEVLFFV